MSQSTASGASKMSLQPLSGLISMPVVLGLPAPYTGTCTPGSLHHTCQINSMPKEFTSILCNHSSSLYELMIEAGVKEIT